MWSDETNVVPVAGTDVGVDRLEKESVGVN